jgi:hypothetical protein
MNEQIPDGKLCHTHSNPAVVQTFSIIGAVLWHVHAHQITRHPYSYSAANVDANLCCHATQCLCWRFAISIMSPSATKLTLLVKTISTSRNMDVSMTSLSMNLNTGWMSIISSAIICPQDWIPFAYQTLRHYPQTLVAQCQTCSSMPNVCPWPSR